MASKASRNKAKRSQKTSQKTNISKLSKHEKNKGPGKQARARKDGQAKAGSLLLANMKNIVQGTAKTLGEKKKALGAFFTRGAKKASSKKGLPKASPEGPSCYRSMRAASPVKSLGIFLAKLDCLGMTISEALGSGIRLALAFPGRVLLTLLSRRRISVNKRAFGLAASGISLGLLALVAVQSFPNAYVVEMNGNDVALVAEYKDVEDAVQSFLAENSDYYSSIHYTDQVSYRPVRAKKDDLSSADQVAQICERMNFVALGYKMYVDGEEIATLQTMEEGQALIDRIVDSYKPDTKDGQLTISEVRVAETIEYKEMEVDIQEFTDPERFESFLLHGEEVQQTYTVKKNDTLSQIASRFSLSTDDLRAANPRHQEDHSYLQVGEVLNLNLVEKPIHVTAKGTLTREESIPFDTTYTKDSTMWKGQYKTVEQGEAGLRHVEYEVAFENGLETARAEIGQQTIQAPKNKVVANGSKYMTPSRGGGDGEVAWPLRGRITSPYGWRSRGFHTGLDIASSSGSPIYAAGSGRVIGSAWAGNYGRLIKIDHGDGLETRYAHLSSFKVSYGDKVSRGDLIGTVGSTGRSTGPHLHFEVRINGAAKNPINYLD